ncbi:hypothetical protein B2J93_7826 [Marssonina coronariae]|uniref:Uncharacterized protein n=1 Tax=Diplocarpon coronariae TaxID=2795749 RepID=A0A218ZCK5_9HELO|nr:hypothetical protein B2J93_7826 [Marssonina coronariae]
MPPEATNTEALNSPRAMMGDPEVSTSTQTPDGKAKAAKLLQPKSTKATDQDEAARRAQMTAEERFDEDGFCVVEEASTAPVSWDPASMVDSTDSPTPRPAGRNPPSSGVQPPSQNPRARVTRGGGRARGVIKRRAAGGLTGVGFRASSRGSPSLTIQDERHLPDAPLLGGPPQGYFNFHYPPQHPIPRVFYGYASNTHPAGSPGPGLPPNFRESSWLMGPPPSSHQNLSSTRDFGPQGSYLRYPVDARSIRQPATFQHGPPSHLAAGNRIGNTPNVPAESLGWPGPPRYLRYNPSTSSAGLAREPRAMVSYPQNMRPEPSASQNDNNSQGFWQPHAYMPRPVDAYRNHGTMTARNQLPQWRQMRRSSGLMPPPGSQHGSMGPAIADRQPPRTMEEVHTRILPTGSSALPATSNFRPAQDTVRAPVSYSLSRRNALLSIISQRLASVEVPRLVAQPEQLPNSRPIMQDAIENMKAQNTSSFSGTGPVRSQVRNVGNPQRSSFQPSSSSVPIASRVDERSAGEDKPAVARGAYRYDSDPEEPYLSPSVKLGPGGESPPSRKTARARLGNDSDIELSPRCQTPPRIPTFSHYVDTRVIGTQARPWLTVVRELHDLSYYFGTLITEFHSESRTINRRDFQTRWRAVIGISRQILLFEIVPSSTSAGVAQKKALGLSQSLWGSRTDTRRDASRDNLDIFRQIIDEILTEVLKDEPKEQGGS